MPLQRERYPAEWERISLAARERAGWRCEFCGATHGQPNPETGSLVVLTVAHLDHNPANCAPGNLRALCQACHLRYDAREHADHARETRAQKSGQMALGLDAEDCRKAAE
jgi:5-methylcytosine-specific restriction endonuclease McrA